VSFDILSLWKECAMSTPVKRWVRLGLVGIVATGAVVLAAAPASAHVTVSPSGTAAGSFTVLTFSVPHGCDGSGTTEVSIQIPESILSVTPTVNPNWTVEKVMAPLDPPVTDSHGNEVTERVAEVVYTAREPLPDDLRDKFELSLQLPDTPGETLMFPAVQACEEGETAWVQETVEGQEEPEHPAPAFEVTEAAGEHGEADGTEMDSTDTVATGAESSAAESDGGSGTSAVSWVALGLGGLGALLGLLALLRPRLLASRTTS
jgi:uncharacterized protein YcnI